MKTSYLQRANQLKKEGKLEAAIAFYQQAIDENPTFYYSHYNLGEALAKIGRHEEAIVAYKHAIEINPNSVGSYCNIGDVFFELGQWKEALLSYYRVLELTSNGYSYYNKLGEVLYHLSTQVNQETIQELWATHQELLTIVQNSGLTKNQVINLRSYIIDDELFLEETNKLIDEKFVEKVYDAYLNREADEVGKRNYLYLLSEKMTRIEVLAAFRNSEEFAARLFASMRTIELYKLDDLVFLTQTGKLSDELFVEEVYYTYLKRESDREGKKYYLNYLLSKTMSRDQIIVSIRQSSEFLVKFVASVRVVYLEASVKAYSQSRTTGQNYHYLQKKMSKSLNELSQALTQQGLSDRELDTNQENFDFHQGLSLLREEKFTQAVDFYKKLIELKPDLVEAYYYLGVALDELNRQEEAIYYWKTALTLKPDWIKGYIYIGHKFLLRGQQKLWWPMLERSARIQQDRVKKYQLENLNFRFIAPFWTGLVGQIALIDWYVKMRLLGWTSNRQILLLSPNQIIANPCYLDYWRSHIDFISASETVQQLSPLTEYLEEDVYFSTIANGQTVPYAELGAIVQKQWELEGRSPLLTLSDSDRKKGWRCLQLLGVPRNAWFVCLHVREAGFNDHLHYGLMSQSYRNANIDTYALAIQSIIDRGGWVIRMGDTTMKPLPKMKQVIDYAHSELKSDWMDVFLCANCRFLVGTSSGLCFVPPTFGRPCVLTNWTPMGVIIPWSGRDIYIPKLYKSIEDQHLLNFTELTAPSASIIHIFSGKVLSDLGIEVVDNTSEEIHSLVLEMFDILEGKAEYTEADNQLQAQYKIWLEQNNCYGSSRIGRDFLRKYAILLVSSDSKANQDTKIALPSDLRRDGAITSHPILKNLKIPEQKFTSADNLIKQRLSEASDYLELVLENLNFIG
ncbi:TIGR04372 family glycosyltransferase [Microcoleus sp. A006_D1]|uniref:TIGR04372 family glycosyltransferase n=1 Tax=Microcoleus sp. A006_D1 TaxID=3055267 RepID=UPI002FD2DA86